LCRISLGFLLGYGKLVAVIIPHLPGGGLK
jgi:hypothetical protein